MTSLQRILVVDDEPDILTVTRFTLRKRGDFEVETCDSSSDAVESAARFAPDLILLDVMMPGRDGPATLRALRADNRTAGIPIVFMTAKVMADEQERYRALGAIGVIAKPFDQATLTDQVRGLWQAGAGPTSRAAGGEGEGEEDDIFAAYAARLPSRIAELAAAWSRCGDGGDSVAELCRLAHRLAGTSATYGYSEVSDLAGRLEGELHESGEGLDGERRGRIQGLLATLAEASRRPDGASES